MEKLLAGHIVDYLERFGLITSNQFGFKMGRSTDDQLLLAYSDVVSEVDQRNIVDMVYLDLSKVFDVVSHQILIGKVVRLGFNSAQIIGWIEGFLRVRIMSSMSIYLIS